MSTLSSPKIAGTADRSSVRQLIDAAPRDVMGNSVVSDAPIDLTRLGRDASHYDLRPAAVATPQNESEVGRLLEVCRANGRSVTFRSGGTSLSGQGVTQDVLVDTRKNFRRIEVLDEGLRIRAQPGSTVRQVNLALAHYGRKIGPDPASEIACTMGGVIANNSSGMACGTHSNAYQTLESVRVVLADSSIIDTEGLQDDFDALNPVLAEGLRKIRSQILADPGHAIEIRRQFSMKNTMGYSINAFLDFDAPVDLFAHLMVGSEGTLGFVSSAVLRTLPVQPHIATDILVFPSTALAVEALAELRASGAKIIELMDASSLFAAQKNAATGDMLADVRVDGHAALLVEYQEEHEAALELREEAARVSVSSLECASMGMTRSPKIRGNMWQVRKGLLTTVAAARPARTTALLEDIVVPSHRLADTCKELAALLERFGYEDAATFGHALDANLHFLISQSFASRTDLRRYESFTAELVELVLSQGGSLKAEHGTGRVMAPFVRRQYGDALYKVMQEVKSLFDPEQTLNPGVILTNDPNLRLKNLKLTSPVTAAIDQCIECGYC